MALQSAGFAEIIKIGKLRAILLFAIRVRPQTWLTIVAPKGETILHHYRFAPDVR